MEYQVKEQEYLERKGIDRGMQSILARDWNREDVMKHEVKRWRPN